LANIYNRNANLGRVLQIIRHLVEDLFALGEIALISVCIARSFATKVIPYTATEAFIVGQFQMHQNQTCIWSGMVLV
jgi:hypothetical protein